MYYYFCSGFPSVIKINGIYYGSCHECVKKLNYDGEQPPFIELCSLSPNENSVFILLDNDFLAYPPENVAVTDLKGGYLINFKPCYNKAGFEILAQEKYPYAVVTVFNDNGVNLSIETPNDFFTERIKVNAKSATITQFNDGGNNFLAVNITTDKTLLYVFSVTDKVKKVFVRAVESVQFTNGLCTSESFCDMEKHRISIVWEYDGGEFKEKSRTIDCDKKLEVEKLNQNLIPYAFLERLLVGDDVEPFLCEQVKENRQSLPDYLGSYIGVCPPPDFLDTCAVGLIYRKGKNLYSVEYFNFYIEHGKISNIEKI